MLQPYPFFHYNHVNDLLIYLLTMSTDTEKNRKERALCVQANLSRLFSCRNPNPQGYGYP